VALFARLRSRPHPALAAAALLLVTISSNLLLFRGQALATSFLIESPADGAVLGDGNLVLVDVVARESQPGAVNRVEIAVDDGLWEAATHSTADPTRWRYFWSDPSPGRHQIQARALGADGNAGLTHSISVDVQDRWTSSFIVDNPYAVHGRFRKGELHTHSTFSFDGWSSMHPGDLAQTYKRYGYSFVAITDHDVVSYPRELISDDFLVVPAYESTSESGHITAIFSTRVVPPDQPAQARLDFIRDSGGMAILNHPTWQVGWSGTDLGTLQGCFAIEIFNGMTSTDHRAARAVRMWHDLLNARGHARRLWAVATDDAHDPQAMNRGWVMVKSPALTEDAIRGALQRGAFYASNGPSFAALGVLDGSITASSPDAATIRFIDQDLNVVHEGPPGWSGYYPQGTERWIRVEAVTADGKTAWSQPFWLLPNAPDAGILRPLH